MKRFRVLILGGTAESFELAEILGKEARCDPTLSLAGATSAPRLPSIHCRTGGFGGVAGLVRYLEQESIRLLISATHPFAAQIRRHAIEAARTLRCPLLILQRPAWTRQSGDRWIPVPDMLGAVAALGSIPRRVLLTIGRKELGPFVAESRHTYVIRTIEPPRHEQLRPGVELIMARGPFADAEERELLVSRRIEFLVTKNSGGVATEAKLRAARDCGVPVIMVERPAMPPLAQANARVVSTVGEALEYLRSDHKEFFSTQRVV